MKRTLCFAVIVIPTILVSGCGAPRHTAVSDVESAYMRGAVRQVRETRYDSPDKLVGLPPVLDAFDVYTVIEYNRAGNITRMNSFRGPDSIHFVKEEYFYDPAGERMMRSESHNPVRHTVQSHVYNYDRRGRLTSEEDAQGSFRTDFKYNRRGYLLNEESRTADSIVVIRYEYDRSGMLRKVTGGGIPTKTYSYHPDGTVAEITYGDNVTERYDAHGNLVEDTHIVTSRDEEMRIVEQYPITLKAGYDYDPSGNWIKRTLRYNGKVQNIAVREISYYE